MRYGDGAPDCPFCTLPPDRVVGQTACCLIVRDAFPVSPGHTLLIPKRHCTSPFELSAVEFAGLRAALVSARRALIAGHGPDGFNIGINDGPAAGQTVMHLHVHLIPPVRRGQRRSAGGVRWVRPERARYRE